MPQRPLLEPLHTTGGSVSAQLAQDLDQLLVGPLAHNPVGTPAHSPAPSPGRSSSIACEQRWSADVSACAASA